MVKSASLPASGATPPAESVSPRVRQVESSVGKVLRLEQRKGMHAKKMGSAIKGTIESCLRTATDAAVLLSNVRKGHYFGEPEFGGRFVYGEAQDAQEIVKLSDYSWVTVEDASPST